MSRPPFNPHLSISSPFPREELPALFCWMDRIRDTAVGDEVPRDLNEFVEVYSRRMEFTDTHTWAVFKDGALGGHLESLPIGKMNPYDEFVIEEALQYIAQAAVVFKRDLWGLKNTVPALNLGLKSIFDTGTETVFFPSFADNRALIELFKAVGCSSLGRTLPRMRKGVPVPIELWAITATEWETRNGEFLREDFHPAEVVAV
jgi:hypothetical protein